MSRTLLPRGALSAYSAAVDHVLRVDESTCRAEGVRISSGSFIPPILVGWFRPGGPRRRSARCVRMHAAAYGNVITVRTHARSVRTGA